MLGGRGHDLKSGEGRGVKQIAFESRLEGGGEVTRGSMGGIVLWQEYGDAGSARGPSRPLWRMSVNEEERQRI